MYMWSRDRTPHGPLEQRVYASLVTMFLRQDLITTTDTARLD